MEPRKTEKPKESRGEGQAAPPRPTERKRRFQLIKLEERIAPSGGPPWSLRGHSLGRNCCGG